MYRAYIATRTRRWSCSASSASCAPITARTAHNAERRCRGPGLFNALNGLGGGGQLDSRTSANANTAVYSGACGLYIAGHALMPYCAAFAFFAFFAGWVA